MGRTISLIFRADPNKARNWEEAKSVANHLELQNLFYGIDDLEPDHKILIEFIIKEMMASNAEKRCNLEFAIQHFEKILLERKVKDKSTESIADINAAFKIGITLGQECEDFSNYFPNINQRPSDSLLALKNLLITHLAIIKDEKEIISEFLSLLGIHSLQGLKSKEDIIDEIEMIIDDYEGNYGSLLSLLDDINETLEETKDEENKVRLLNIHYIISQTIAKGNCPLTLDNLSKLADKYEKCLGKYQSEVEEFQEKVAKRTVKSSH